MRIWEVFGQRTERRLTVQESEREGENCVDSFVGKPHEYVVRARILRFEYANTARKLRIVDRKTARPSYTFSFGIGDTNKIVVPVREASIPGPTVRPSQVRSDNQPSVPHPRVHSPIRWADWLSRLRPWGGQTRLTGCHGDLMDWSEQISSPKTPERIAGFQRIALASARWVSFHSSFLRSFRLPSSGLCVRWLVLSWKKMKSLRSIRIT